MAIVSLNDKACNAVRSECVQAALAGEMHGKTLGPLSGSWFLLEQRGSNHRGSSLHHSHSHHLHLFLLRGGGCEVGSHFLLIVSIFQDVVVFLLPIFQRFITFCDDDVKCTLKHEDSSCRNCFLFFCKCSWQGLLLIHHPAQRDLGLHEENSNRKMMFTFKDERSPWGEAEGGNVSSWSSSFCSDDKSLTRIVFHYRSHRCVPNRILLYQTQNVLSVHQTPYW